MSLKNILVTGGLGFIGSHTVVALHEAGLNPVIVDNLDNTRIEVLDGITEITGSKPTFYQFDYRDSAQLVKLLKDEKIDGVIHFAAYKAVGESVEQPLKYYDNNVAGFVGLVQLLSKHKVPLIFSSSATVYGSAPELPLVETAPFSPATNPYGSTKQICERIIADVTAAGHLRCVVLRYFNPIGAHPSAKIGELPLGTPANLIPLTTQATAGVRPFLTVFGTDYDTPDGSAIRDYIHVVDLADAHVAAIQYLADDSVRHDIFNVGSGQGNSVLEVIKTFETVNKVKVPYKIGPRRAGDIGACYANVDKIKQMLGWQTKLSLADGLRDAWRWQQSLGKPAKK